MAVKPFQFGAGVGPVTSRDQLIDRVRKIEDLGYATLGTGHHISRGTPGVFALLGAAAAVTTSIRFSTMLPVDFFQPALLAQEAATLDLISGGRLNLGLGAGWMGGDFDVVGVPFESGGRRLGRLAEAVRIIKTLVAGECAPAGAHYPAMGPLVGAHSPARPPPPIFLGGSGRRMLSLAAREADIVGIDLSSTPQGTMDMASLTVERVAEKVDWVREAAGDRCGAIDLNILVHNVFVVDDRMRGARMAADRLASWPPTVLTHADLSLDQLIASPHVLVGSVDQIAETLCEHRERFGISWVNVMPPFAEEFAPVVARLTGK
jgi:probable F420-dependent oxidoreductase